MNTLAVRLALVIPFLDTLVVGFWNQLFPESFYTTFPTVDLNPPFSEHFARDFGGTSLAIAVVLGIALVKPKTHYVVPAAVGFSVFAVPHFFFHLLETHPEMMWQEVVLTAANALVALLGLAAIALALLRDRRRA
ncbi:hypothetical protein VSH64_21500 [Amycolatopsis rhabdoformis]|uniref:Uncharacterized protein n=1 Tax=Amycolatopsis rhabdoformis TaxID=1448059 RepID=A0ABZ1ILG0_9PSEU|nr:hypothetical protein [Amycolatopsis rhabdoformis]WSE34623.1 hypothetical protein VSH64_21500 [Amycolatopsis rhabdoformis]